MPKYILHGGNTRERNNLNEEYFNELENSLEAGDVLLVCFFAPSENSGRSEEEKFNSWKESYSFYVPDSKIKLEFALKDKFIDQLKKADGLYLHGGMTDGLHTALSEYPDFIDLAKSLIIVSGSSAGAYVLAKYSIDYAFESEVKKRLGFLPIKIFCHFMENDRKILEEKFMAVDPKNELELVLLRDCEMKVY